MKEACKLAGICDDAEVVAEPIAALNAFGLHKDQEPGSLILVVHFGGSTAELSLLEIKRNNIVKIVENIFDLTLGGKDIDLLLVDIFKTKLQPPIHAD